MSTPFALDFGNESIATTFATCVSCFDYTLQRRVSDRSALRLSVVRLRLTRWGEAACIYDDPKPRRTNPKPDDFEAVKGAMIEIIALFEALATSINREDIEEPAHGQPADPEQPPLALLKVLEDIAATRSRRPQHTSLLEPRVLALGERSEKLVEASSKCIDTLEEYLPAPQRQRSLSGSDKMRIGNTLGVLGMRVLENVAANIDPWMCSGIISEGTIKSSNIGLSLIDTSLLDLGKKTFVKSGNQIPVDSRTVVVNTACVDIGLVVGAIPCFHTEDSEFEVSM